MEINEKKQAVSDMLEALQRCYPEPGLQFSWEFLSPEKDENVKGVSGPWILELLNERDELRKELDELRKERGMFLADAIDTEERLQKIEKRLIVNLLDEKAMRDG